MFSLDKCQYYASNLDKLIAVDETSKKKGEMTVGQVMGVANQCLRTIRYSPAISKDKKVAIATDLLRTIERCRVRIQEKETQGWGGYLWSFIKTPDKVQQVAAVQTRAQAVLEGIRKERDPKKSKITKGKAPTEESREINPQQIQELDADVREEEQKIKEQQEMEELEALEREINSLSLEEKTPPKDTDTV